jgi:hypothetical protein
MKLDRFERQDDFAALIHRFNAFLKAARGVARAELSVGVHDHIYAVEVPHCNPANVADIASGTYVEGSSIAWGADGNNVIARSLVGASFAADAEVFC